MSRLKIPALTFESLRRFCIMKVSKLKRIYTNQLLVPLQILDLPAEDAHYLQNVLRLIVGDKLRIFNQLSGEFMGEIIGFSKYQVKIHLLSHCRRPQIEPELILGLGIIKTDRMLAAVNMAVQLGVTEIVPVISQRSQCQTINAQKLQRCIIDATEQSERLSPPRLQAASLLSDFQDFNLDIIFYANEHEITANSIYQFKTLPGRVSLIIGPEGGLNDQELAMLSDWPQAHSVSLGSNVLRSETAACAGLAQLQLIRQASAT